MLLHFGGAQAGATTEGVDGTCSVLTYSTPSATEATCNGNGDGQIGAGSDENYHEWFRAWQHMANAGLVAGSFTGVPGAAGYIDSVAGENIPESKYSGAGWSIRWWGDWSVGDWNTFSGKYFNVLTFGGYTSNDMVWNPIIDGADSENIDRKIDDGKPNLGKVLSAKNAWRPNCINSSNDAYLVENDTKGCTLFFMTDF